MKSLVKFINENIITESFKSDWLREIDARFKELFASYNKALDECDADNWWRRPTRYGVTSIKELLNRNDFFQWEWNTKKGRIVGIRWDKVTDDYAKEVGPDEAKRFIARTYRGKEVHLIIGLNTEGQIQSITTLNNVYVFNDEDYGLKNQGGRGPQYEKIDKGLYGRGYQPLAKFIVFTFDPTNDPEKVCIAETDADFTRNRKQNQQGIVRNDEAYYQELANANRERWQKTIAKKHAELDDDSDILEKITDIMDRIAEVDLAAVFSDYSRASRYQATLNMINSGTGLYSGRTLICMFYAYRSAKKDSIKGSGYTKTAKELDQMRDNLMQLIDQINKRIDAI